MKDAKDTMEVADSHHKRNIARFEEQSEKTNKVMDKLGEEELRILSSFKDFTRVFEKIHNMPKFEKITKDGVDLPRYNAEELKKVPIGSKALLARNITLSFSLFIGGIITNIIGSSLSDKADKAWSQMMESEEEINKICSYLESLHDTAERYNASLITVDRVYNNHLEILKFIVKKNGKTDWRTFVTEEKLMTENLVLLVGVLFNMCKVDLVLVNEEEGEINKVNTIEVERAINAANKALEVVV